MKTRARRRRGALLLETLISLLLTILIGASLTSLLQNTYISQSNVSGQNLTSSEVRTTLDTLTAHLSNAQAYQTSASPVTFSALSAGSATSVTCYTNTTGDTERYWLDTTTSPQTLKRTQTVSGVTTTTVIVIGVQALQLTYSLTNGANYTASSWVSSTSAPTAANLPNVGAISIVATVTINGYQQQLSTFVRLRNSPYRS